MADAVLTITLETIRDLLVDEAKFLFEVRGEVKEIEVELKRMKVFLRNADSKKDEDETLANRVAEIRQLANEVEIVLETFAIEVTKPRGGGGGGVKNTLKRYACFCNKGVALHKVGLEIVSIKNKITNLTRSFQTYDLGQVQSSDSSAQQKQLLQQWQRQTFPHFEEDFVGMEEDIRQLVFHLVNNTPSSREENQRCPTRVVSICGMGGLGKTSLAKKVYNHDEVRQYFDLFAWACITQQWQPRDILQEILIGLVPQKKEYIPKMRDSQLFEELYQVQRNKKCLIVIDDIWSKDAWDSLRLFALPDHGSKVLLTTRDKKVALHADPSGFLHEPECLNEEDSWNLLKKKAFPRNIDTAEFIVHSDMEEMGREMVRQCRGLPLAVVVLGGILVRKHTSEEWEMVLQNIKTYLVRGEDIIRKEGGGGVSCVLALSYKNLPYQLKACFLYLGNFPEDAEIEAEKLYHLWVAERLVLSEDKLEGETMVDVAERYLGELAQRCMVQLSVEETWKRKRIESCRLHDLMRELCLSKVKEENFLKKLMISSQENEPASDEYPSSFATNSSTKTRRLAIYCENSKDDRFPTSLKKERCENIRSLLFFKVGVALSINTVMDNIKNFKLLRILDLEGAVSGEELPETIGMLLQLEYLSLKNTTIEKLPSCIEKLVYLQTLDLRVTYLFIPNVLWKLERLRHLYLPGEILKEMKLRLDGLKYLETLVNFNSNAFDVKDLWELRNLRKLIARVGEELEDRRNLLTSITSKNSLLKQSEIVIWNGNLCSEEELIVLRNLLGCHHLFRLFLGVPISKLPEYNQFSPSLTELVLRSSNLDEDVMPTLEKLPFLIKLCITSDAFMGKEMVCSEMGFPQLTKLDLILIPNLESWRVDKGAFPKLSILNIKFCEKLKMIPDGLSFVTSLKQLTIISNESQLENRLRVVNGEGGEDLYKVRHVPSITLDDSDSDDSDSDED